MTGEGVAGQLHFDPVHTLRSQFGFCLFFEAGNIASDQPIQPVNSLTSNTNIIISVDRENDTEGAIPAHEIDSGEVGVLLQEDQLNDDETEHAVESVGYLIIGN